MSDFIVKTSGTLNIIDNYLDSFMDKDEEKKNAKVKNLVDDFEIINKTEEGKNVDNNFGFDDLDYDEELDKNNIDANNEKDEIEKTNFDDISDKQRLTTSYKKLNYNLPTRIKNNLKTIQIKVPVSSWDHYIGRKIQKVVNYFNSDISSSTNLSKEDKINVLKGKEMLPPLPELKDKNAEPFYMNTEQMGIVTGLGADAKISPFDKTGELDYLQVLFGKEGIPQAEDIKQDANLQDCWFLSSISAVMSALGPTAITRLFSKSEKPNNVIVRLGENTYDVPLGRIKYKGWTGTYKFGSKSANWVVVLENAMMMHRACHNSTARDVEMSMQSPLDGLNALLGYGNGSSSVGIPMGYYENDEEFIDAIRQNLKKNLPVMLGHDFLLPQGIRNMKYIDQAKEFSNACVRTARISSVTGIAPSHAVTVLEILDMEKKVKVLDPYGQIKHIPFNYIREFRGNTVSKS